jgi:hypothetical protein
MYGVLSNSGINNATGLWKKQTLVHPAASVWFENVAVVQFQHSR